MQVQMTGHNLEITPAIRSYAEKKLERINSFADHITHIHLTFQVEKIYQIALANISVPGTQIHVEAKSEDMHESIDKLIDKVMRQLNKYKDKQRT